MLKKRLLSLLLCGALVFGLCLPAAAVETETEKYLTWDDAQKTLVENDIPTPITPVITGTTELNSTTTGGWYIVRGSIEIESRVTVIGEVHLIRADSCNLTAARGIGVGEGNSLTIYAQSASEGTMGALTAKGSGPNAAIAVNGGTITINGGKVTATASGGGVSTGGAAIGGDSDTPGGTIIINGGIVEATTEGGSSGAGIGGGSYASGGTITINGGTVTATGNNNGAGIGGGAGGAGGTIIISGGTVTATSIGGGADRNGNMAPSDKIEISGNATVKGSDVGDPIIGPTAHGAKGEWAYDGSSHWHPCKKEGCAEHKYDTAAHSFGDWITDTGATATTAGSKHRECGTCQYQETETIPATGGGSGGGGYIPPAPPTYPPTVEQPDEGGSVGVSPSRPQQGDTVTVTPKPDAGYEVGKITVTGQSGKPVEVTKKPDGTYTFKQPGGRVTIEIIYNWINPFTDLDETAWYYEAVKFVQENGLMNGFGDGRFAPHNDLSRSQLAQILFNKEGRPATETGEGFADINSGAWYAGAVAWAAENGIVSGYGNGAFGPNDPITREQLAVMLWRYSGRPTVGRDAEFADMDAVSSYALEAVDWARANGIVQGKEGNRFDPQGTATRAEVAQMLKNFLGNQKAFHGRETAFGASQPG